MEKLTRMVFSIVIAICVFAGLLSMVYKSNAPAVQFPEIDADSLQQEFIQARNKLSRLLNQKQHQLAKMECEKVEREKKKELISESGGWCIHDAKELGEGGFHATDHKLAAALAEFFRGKHVASFGDGPGRYKQLLDKTGQLLVYDAYDGAPYSQTVSEGRVQFLDLSIPQYGLPLYDYVISLEVAEHIPKEFEQIYVDNVLRHAKEGIVISWAWPGQDGHSHVNEKAFKDVIKIMEDNGFQHEKSLSDNLRKSCTFYWLKDNISVFKRKEINEGHLLLNT